jgi:superfamily II DNA or RNA helicase
MQPIDTATANALIDFTGGAPELAQLGKQQLEGAVALHNMLARHGMAYLADEVGMGKTYIALGVVALMRRFQPGLRVLYLLPKNNVRDKWRKDYHSFINSNYLVRDLCVKGLNDLPAARYVVSRGLHDLIQSVATDSARDFFICSSAFSFPLGNNEIGLIESLEHLCDTLPQGRTRAEELRKKIEKAGKMTASTLADFKREVKECWAGTLNAILPQFDLVVVDEAHNFRRGTAVSDRNAILARILGTGDPETSKVRRLLLLSATPFDRDLRHLQNQLALFGKENLLSIRKNMTWEETHAALSGFMVRRLNSMDIDGRRHTRNMYRTEHRCGKRAEIKLQPEQQLFAALLQKKVSEYLQEDCNGRFELGMLSSFESYLPGEKGRPIQFDGQDDTAMLEEGRERDAPDRHIVECLVRDYFDTFDRKTPPHPKMDAIATAAHVSGIEHGKKQLVFVRRVRSVSELKYKIETEYNTWLGGYIASDPAVKYWFDHYQSAERQLSHSVEDGAPGEEMLESSSASFFAWFYRGSNAMLESQGNREHDLGQIPFNFSTTLTSSSMMFELNWSTLPGMPAPDQLTIDWAGFVPRTKTSATPKSRFENAQYAYLKSVVVSCDGDAKRVAERILAVAFIHFSPGLDFADPRALRNDLQQLTFWDRVGQSGEIADLYPHWTRATFDKLAVPVNRAAEHVLLRLLTHQKLAAVVCRLDHPFIDLYSLRNTRREGTHGSADQELSVAFLRLLEQQARSGIAFSSCRILRDIAHNLDLLIKLNFPEAYQTAADELTQYFANQLRPLAPVIGATGENSPSRSAMARKFRMPGYPRVLVSTDVFQEGEDLHTFCDHVVHYGISTSPIAIEQKIGRVDRVASLAQRALQDCKEQHDAHFIQVAYPHIRESMEFFQVRQAAANLNEFQRSLHHVGGEEREYESQVDINAQLVDESPIPAQLRNELHSPFDVSVKDLIGANCVRRLAQEHGDMDARVKHAQERVEACIGEEYPETVALTEGAQGLYWSSQEFPAVNVRLRSATGLPELLLSISQDAGPHFDETSIGPENCIAYLKNLQQDSRVRLQLVPRGENRRAAIVRNAEIYAGTEHVLVDHEVHDTLNRVRLTTGTQWNSTPDSPLSVDEQVAVLCGSHDGYRISRLKDGRLRYHFEHEGRHQDVQWEVAGSHVLISSVVLNAEATEEHVGNPEFLLENTLRRNARFDVIDFHINSTGELAVRALHPVTHLNHAELAFVSLAVATESDRLQHVLTCGEDTDEEDNPLQQLAPVRTDQPLRPSEIDTNDMMCTIRELLGSGPMSRAFLIRQIARELGYRKTSQNIADVINTYVTTASRRGITRMQDGAIQLEVRSISDYDRDFLKTQFLAALSAQSAGFVDRHDAIRGLARWMGYARTGPVIDETAKSLINGLLREYRLEARGQEIKRSR